MDHITSIVAAKGRITPTLRKYRVLLLDRPASEHPPSGIWYTLEQLNTARRLKMVQKFEAVGASGGNNKFGTHLLTQRAEVVSDSDLKELCKAANWSPTTLVVAGQPRTPKGRGQKRARQPNGSPASSPGSSPASSPSPSVKKSQLKYQYSDPLGVLGNFHAFREARRAKDSRRLAGSGDTVATDEGRFIVLAQGEFVRSGSLRRADALLVKSRARSSRQLALLLQSDVVGQFDGTEEDRQQAGLISLSDMEAYCISLGQSVPKKPQRVRRQQSLEVFTTYTQPVVC